MFPWNIAKSAEAMFSRWAIKRVCQFLLKKKLGQLILGDIDLNQLDVQLRAGTIQLSDLALNVDYLNQKFGAEAAVIVKEGSIGSLLVTMPWKGKGCEIDVEELELVLAPCGGLNYQFGSGTHIPKKDGNYSTIHEPGRLEHEKVENAMMSASLDVHEGVKTIAKMVKWLLTSFHVKVRKLIVAFDSSLVENEKNIGFYNTLVLRISEIECGTCISEEAASSTDSAIGNFLGLNQLTNFVKFQGATLEFLQVDGVGNEIHLPCASGTTFGEWFSACCPSNVRTPVVTGERGGFSGTLKLSIPWKNGSLDIRKVDADAHIDPLELRFQPSSMKWFLFLLEIIKESGKNSKDHVDYKTAESVYFNASSDCHPSTLGSSVTSNGTVMLCNENIPSDFCCPLGKDATALLPESQLISDWVPFSISKNQKGGTEVEPDFGASIEQFFECFDGMRNSQSALGSSGMWNWTCSVFSAITAASNLASGSLHIASEQQHVETNLKVTVSGISVLFSLLDGDQQRSCDGDQTNGGSYAHYLGAKFHDIVLVLQVCPQEMNLKAMVEHIELSDHFSNGDDAMEFGFRGCNDIEGQMLMIQQIQAAVQGALPPFSSSAKDACSEEPHGSVPVDFPFMMSRLDRCISRTNYKGIYRDDVVKTTFLRTSGGTHCQFTVNSSSSDDNFTGPISFSLKLPPVLFWVNSHLINDLLGLLREVGNSFEMDSTKDGSVSECFNSVSCSSSQGEVKRRSCSSLKTSSPQECLRGNIFLTTARVIFCFPFENNGDLRSYAYWNEFIALDFSSPSNLIEENVQVTAPFPNASSQKSYSSTISRSYHLNVGNLDIYLITSASHGSVQSNDDGKQGPKYFAENIFSSTNRRGHLSVISILWQKDAVTGPWMGKRAKLIATPEDSRVRNRFVGKDYEFASVTTAKDMEEFNNHARKDMILSSEFFVHACLSPVKINLASSQFKGLHRLLRQAIDWLSSEVSDPVSVKNDSTVSQTSILVECDSAEISVCQEMIESIKSSIQNELPGSWHRLKLQIENFQLLSVSNIGGIGGSNFFWLTHGEGNLRGSITGVPNEEFLLISCSNSTMGRGDGEGSNVLSSKFSGSEIIHMWDPETSHSSMSITVRCGTIVAVGGRLDWLDTISSFFSLASPEDGNSMKKGNSVDGMPCESSFVLTLVDVGLSYEPYLKGLMVSEVFDADFSSVNNEGIHGQHVACLLAASLLKLSNSKVADCIDSDYKIGLQDLGLLICAVPGSETVSGRYSVGHLRQVGYVKVAQEANFDAILRMNCENDLWELECSGSHIFLDTCHDTTSGLIRLAAQLQQLFAPDVEESIVHLQTRWNNVQMAQENDETRFCNGNSVPSTSQVDTSHLDMKRKPGVVNLMDEICEDAFHLDGHWDGKSDPSELQLRISVDNVLEETCDLSARDPESSPHNLPLPGSAALKVPESSQPSFLQKGFPELIESYFLTESCPMSELSQQKQSSNDIHKQKSRNMAKGDVEKLSNGWYEGGSLNIVEDHVSDLSMRTGPQLVAEETTPSNCCKTNDHGKARGRVLLKNINVIWRMYSGSDWHNFQKDVLRSPIIGGRDRTVCLELALSGMDFQYEIFPDGEICVSRLSLSVQDFYLNDNSQDAPWKLVLGYYQSKDHPRKSFSKLFKLDLEAVRPDPLTPLEEYRLRMAFLPMLLHLHQSQLDFIIGFFGGKSSTVDQSSNAPWNMSEPEVLSKISNYGGPATCEEALLPYFQKLDMWPVLVRVDYNPCHVDLAALLGGKYVELVNLVSWKGVEIQLKHVQAVGVYGWSSVCETIIGEWLEDISQRQIRKLLRGLPPIRALASVSSGAAQLVSLPVENYRKDHRLLKGMHRGIIAFLRSISVEAVGLGVHLAAGTHEFLLQAEYIFSRIPQSVPWPVQSRLKTNVRSNQPKNARQGIQQAYESIGDGLGKTASALVRTPLKRYQRGVGVGSALATAVQAAPAAAIAPASAAVRAMHCALLGVRNSLDPEHKKESIEKYLGTTQYRDDMTEG